MGFYTLYESAWANKFKHKFKGPYTIVKQIEKVAYQLALPLTMQQHPVFRVLLLQKEKPRPADMLSNESWEEVSGDEYEVEDILDVRNINNKAEYLIK